MSEIFKDQIEINPCSIKPDGTRKSIMLLGGSGHQVPAIETAKRLGYRTVLCDYLPDNPGQYVADVFYQESTTDRELMLAIARSEGIDGVLSFGSDVAAPTAAYIGETLELPTNPLKSVEILSEKYLFRPYLAEHGFNCPKTVSFSADITVNELMNHARHMQLPVVLKPTDSSGSRGVTVINELNKAAVEAALAYAQEFSRNRILVLEEYITYEYPYLIGGDIFVAEGKVQFWGLMQCLRDKELAALVPVGKAYPAGLTTKQMAAAQAEIQRLVTSLNLKFGEMNVEVIIGPNNTPYILELAGRAGGNMIPLQLQDISGINLIEALVRYSMGEPPANVTFTGNSKLIATSVLHARQTGSFKAVTYAPEIEPYVYREIVYVQPGDHVEKLNYGAKAIGVVFLEFKSKEEYEILLPRINQLIQVQVYN